MIWSERKGSLLYGIEFTCRHLRRQFGAHGNCVHPPSVPIPLPLSLYSPILPDSLLLSFYIYIYILTPPSPYNLPGSPMGRALRHIDLHKQVGMYIATDNYRLCITRCRRHHPPDDMQYSLNLSYLAINPGCYSIPPFGRNSLPACNVASEHRREPGRKPVAVFPLWAESPWRTLASVTRVHSGG